MASSNYFYGLGRRKSSTARVRVFSGKGEFEVNDQTANDYFDGSKYLLSELMQPFKVLELDPEKFSFSAKVAGGGHASQRDAIGLGISKALVVLNEDRSEEHTSELQSRFDLVCRLLLEKKK